MVVVVVVVPPLVAVEEKIGERGEAERDGERRPRERISGKIIAKFEYDSPRGYDPVEDIPEILQASFVRGLISLSAVFFSSPSLPAHPPTGFFSLARRRSFACRQQRFHPPFVAPRLPLLRERTNLRASHAVSSPPLYEEI